MPDAFDLLVAAVAEADSEFRLSRIPIDVIRDGVRDLDARLKALEGHARGDWSAESAESEEHAASADDTDRGDELFSRPAAAATEDDTTHGDAS